jgi:hypothetical protein
MLHVEFRVDLEIDEFDRHPREQSLSDRGRSRKAAPHCDIERRYFPNGFFQECKNTLGVTDQC